MKTKYTEIFKLKKMLEEEGIAFEFRDRRTPHYEFWQIIVLREDESRLISVIEGMGTYGQEENLLEINGCLTEEEMQDSCVKGYLTAEEVFDRIVKAVKGGKNEN